MFVFCLWRASPKAPASFLPRTLEFPKLRVWHPFTVELRDGGRGVAGPTVWRGRSRVCRPPVSHRHQATGACPVTQLTQLGWGAPSKMLWPGEAPPGSLPARPRWQAATASCIQALHVPPSQSSHVAGKSDVSPHPWLQHTDCGPRCGKRERKREKAQVCMPSGSEPQPLMQLPDFFRVLFSLNWHQFSVAV